MLESYGGNIGAVDEDVDRGDKRLGKNKAPTLSPNPSNKQVAKWVSSITDYLDLQNTLLDIFIPSRTDGDDSRVREIVISILGNIQDEGLRKVAEAAVVDKKSRFETGVVKWKPQTTDEGAATDAAGLANKGHNLKEAAKLQDDILSHFIGLKKMMHAVEEFKSPMDICTFILLHRKWEEMAIETSEDPSAFLVRRNTVKRAMIEMRDRLGINPDNFYELLDGFKMLSQIRLTPREVTDLLPDDQAKLKTLTLADLEKEVRALNQRKRVGKALSGGNVEHAVAAVLEQFGVNSEHLAQRLSQLSIEHEEDYEEDDYGGDLSALQKKKKFDFAAGRDKGKGKGKGKGGNGKLPGMALPAGQAYETGKCLKCASTEHRLMKCPKASFADKKQGTLEMKKVIKHKRQQLSELELLVTHDEEDIDEYEFEDEYPLHALEVFDEQMDVEPSGHEHEENLHISSLTPTKELDMRRVGAWDCGAAKSVIGQNRVKGLQASVFAATGRTTEVIRKQNPVIFGGVGGSRLKATCDVQIPVSESKDMFIHVISSDDGAGDDQKILIGQDTLTSAGIVHDWTHQEWFSLYDPSTRYSRTTQDDGTITITIEAQVSKNLRMNNGHWGVDVVELAKKATESEIQTHEIAQARSEIRLERWPSDKTEPVLYTRSELIGNARSEGIKDFKDVQGYVQEKEAEQAELVKNDAQTPWTPEGKKEKEEQTSGEKKIKPPRRLGNLSERYMASHFQ